MPSSASSNWWRRSQSWPRPWSRCFAGSTLDPPLAHIGRSSPILRLRDPAPFGASTRGELAPPWTPQHPAVNTDERSGVRGGCEKTCGKASALRVDRSRTGCYTGLEQPRPGFVRRKILKHPARHGSSLTDPQLLRTLRASVLLIRKVRTDG